MVSKKIRFILPLTETLKAQKELCIYYFCANMSTGTRKWVLRDLFSKILPIKILPHIIH